MDSASNFACRPGPAYMRPELHDLKIIGVEEHVAFPDLMQDISNSQTADYARKILGDMIPHPAFAYAKGRGADTGSQRLQDMDEGGVQTQILSFGSPVNCTHLEAEEALALSQKINDRLKEAVDRHPDRYRALAELPFHAPELAIRELRRCVKELGFVGVMIAGSVGGDGTFLDQPQFSELLSEFEALDVPLYLHPGIPPKKVMETYYEGVGTALATAALASSGWGWHQEVAIHVLRLAISGSLDAHPRLKLVVGHQGEMMPMMMQRWDAAFDRETLGLKRSVGEMLRSQVWVAISGLFSIPTTQIAIQTWGVGRVLFANDYPYVATQGVPDFVRAMNDVIGPSDMRKIFQTNAEELFKISDEGEGRGAIV